jgi:hypothetical protein
LSGERCGLVEDGVMNVALRPWLVTFGLGSRA